MSEIIFLRGIPSSGKSTWAKQYIKENPQFKRVSRDEIREQLDFYSNVGNPKNEKLVSEIEKENILSLLSKGFSVIIDITLCSNKYLNDYFKIFYNTGFDLKFEIKTLYTTLDECIKRNFARGQNGGRFVPEEVIHRMYKNFNDGEKSIGKTFDDLVNKYKSNFALKNIYKNLELEPCYVFDIDGTLALMNGRSPFDWSRVKEDSANKNVAMIHGELYISDLNNKIFILSGRDEISRADTEKWLSKNGIFHDGLFMRKNNDHRPDWEVKHELLKENLLDKGLKPSIIFDDRDQVVRFWRHVGLTVAQVAEGNF